jgi:Uma2 family endonuclease
MVSPHSTGVTIEQYLSYKAPPGKEDELIEGEIVLSPSPMPEHADLCARLYDLLKNLLQGSSFLVRQDTSMRLSTSESMPRPDVFVIDQTRWNAAARSKTHPTGSPQLVIEVFSPANDSEAFRKKPRIYLDAGASAVWVVRSESQSIEVYDPQGTRCFSSGQEIHLPPPLPNGVIQINDIFSRA